jgi:GH18 family chitinase
MEVEKARDKHLRVSITPAGCHMKVANGRLVIGLEFYGRGVYR